ncbi:TLDc domain-containing protein [Entamoeba marina]
MLNVSATENEKILYQRLVSLINWSGKNGLNIIYDSDVDEHTHHCFNMKLHNKQNLYLIVHDEFDCVFGGYFGGCITNLNEWNYDSSMFLFRLSTSANGDNTSQKWLLKQGKKGGIWLYTHTNEKCLYKIGGCGCLYTRKPLSKESSCYEVSLTFEDIEDCDLNGHSWRSRDDYFSITRVIVIEMGG